MKRFCEIIGLPDLVEQMPSKAVMLRDKEKLHDQIAPRLKLQDTEYWVEKFQAEDFWVAKVNTYEDVLKDPQVEHNKIIRTIHHPKAGEFKAVMTPIQFSETPVQVYSAPPLLGQDNRKVLGEIGYSAEEIEDILKSGIMG